MATDSMIPEGFQIENNSDIPEGFIEEGSTAGSLPHYENLLQRAIKNPGYKPMEMGISSLVGGPMMAASGTTHAEDSIVPATQIISDVVQQLNPLSRIPGVAPAVTTGMATAGETARQGIKALRGEDFNSDEIKKTAITTGAGELAGRGIGKLMMGGAQNRAVSQELMSKLGAMKEALRVAGDSDPSLWIEKTPIMNTVEELFKKSPNPKGPASGIFQDWMKILSDPNKTHISPRELLQMEEQFGQASKYFPEGSNFLEKLMTRITNPIKDSVLNSGAKEVRGLASTAVDSASEKAGIKGFSDISKQFSKLKGGMEGKGTSWIQQMMNAPTELMAGTAMGQALGGHPIIGALTGIADILRKNPGIQDAIYNTLGKTGLGSIGTTALSQGTNQLTK